MTETAPRFWIGTVSREHVLRAVTGGFAMLNQGMKAPLNRMSPGDWLVYYSPKTAVDGAPLQAFTAIGEVAGPAPYGLTSDEGEQIYRREMIWKKATETPIARLLDSLDFTRGNWGNVVRRGHFEITGADFQTLRTAMLKE
ncbi:EVE domain-containing protein [Paracoccus aminophilus]|uniref:UPF0310 protein JCM7686_2585 n=1 Tax=Paracoccus aminophilus JCM 7686 TaxID=1367847 RepID=S5YDW1_PARAH|nr:EVE domain-containing protein [Paracoccus aminophilus]AGT09653.1 hypothetical protein JCM7686_2585 [Paracoccus aminophilus JCM 7686]